MEKLKLLLLATAVVLCFSAAAFCDWNEEDGHKMHYPQLPDPDGWDVCLCCQWIADDFTCIETGPIDDIHFWISWRGDDTGEVPDGAWDVAIYDDASGAPGNRLWSLQGGNIVVRGPFVGDQGWVCPSPVPPTIIRPDHKNYYQVNITEIEEPFIQEVEKTYWLVIRANILSDPVAVGWKTSSPQTQYQKPALWTLDPSDPASWRSVRDTVDLDIYDMAFVITGREEEEPKWIQPPDLSDLGMDVKIDEPIILADDFLCMEETLITHITLWCSWKDDILPFEEWPGGVNFTLSIHDDIPDPDPGDVTRFSMPGEPLWWRHFGPDEFEVRIFAENLAEGWWDPREPDSYVWPGDKVCWQYDFYIPSSEAFCQKGSNDEPRVYWLDVQAKSEDTAAQIGWKSSLEHWNDDAVWGIGQEPYPGPWNEMLYPPGHPCSGALDFEDLALVQVYNVGDVFSTGGVGVQVKGFEWSDGTWYYGGTANVISAGMAGGSGNEINTNNVNVEFLFNCPPSYLSLLFGEYGGNCNIEINGSFLNFENMIELDGLVIGGVTVLVPVGGSGGDAGRLVLIGNIGQFAIGGQEFFIDDVKISTSVDMAFAIDGKEPCPEEELDFGDAPDYTPAGAGYPTLLANNGAYHVIGGPWFGDDNDMPDVEPDGQPDATATGDDNDGNDDEDGIQIPVLIQGVNNFITMQVNGGGGYVSMWIDWNGDMDWDDPGEVVSFGGPFSDGTYNLSIAPPTYSIIGQTFLRARIHSQMYLSPRGGASEGEVEDHEVYIEEAPPELDFGDAPDSAAAMQYPTLLPNGAHHLIVPGINLGNLIDAEPDGQPTPDADGDDLNNLDDEDGVVFTSTLIPGKPATFDVTASTAGNLNVWIDYNGDYSWAEAGDHVFVDQPIGMGTTTLGFTVPGSATPGIETFARFRFTGPNVVGIGYAGYVREGEVEDYKVKIDKPIIKWSQPPTYDDNSPYPECFWGWDEESVYGWRQIVADDWLCEDYRPITDIHWWGSYLNWMEDIPPVPAPSRFQIGIWTDVPAGADVPWSHPGEMIREWIVPRAELWERPVGCDFHEEYMEMPDTCFRYDLQLHEDEWFWQEKPDTIYWLSISAIYDTVEPPDEFEWGWKTRRHYFNDDAVRIFNPTAPVPGMPFMSGEPIEDAAGNTWDMAFELTTISFTEACEQILSQPGYEKQLADYIAYVANGADPSCWCLEYQCVGDANNDTEGLLTKYRVYTNDLNRVLANWKKKIDTADPCADVAHDSEGLLTKYRVYTNDLNIVLANWKAKDGDLGIPGPCPKTDADMGL